ncbi:MAG: hypothetical protein Q4D64_04200 [Prevotellaceae bacterium]|nr:hypothetical protein [Prevotellaceae bacterium]
MLISFGAITLSSKWLTGRHNFTMQTIAKIETALGCKLINIAE